MRDLLIAGNWKMNASTAASETLVSGIAAGHPGGKGVQLLVCPPFPYLAAVAGMVDTHDLEQAGLQHRERARVAGRNEGHRKIGDQDQRQGQDRAGRHDGVGS